MFCKTSWYSSALVMESLPATRNRSHSPPPFNEKSRVSAVLQGGSEWLPACHSNSKEKDGRISCQGIAVVKSARYSHDTVTVWIKGKEGLVEVK
jgi:hypothetical protein